MQGARDTGIKKFVHCPKPGCDKPLKGSWSDYLTGEMHPKTGLPVYQCPYCHMKFTADTFKANAVPVPEGDGDIVLYDTIKHEVIDVIPHRLKFTDGKFFYIHLPTAFCTRPNLRCFCFKAIGMTYGQAAEVCEDAIKKDNVEVMR